MSVPEVLKRSDNDVFKSGIASNVPVAEGGRVYVRTGTDAVLYLLNTPFRTKVCYFPYFLADTGILYSCANGSAPIVCNTIATNVIDMHRQYYLTANGIISSLRIHQDIPLVTFNVSSYKPEKLYSPMTQALPYSNLAFISNGILWMFGDNSCKLLVTTNY